MSVFSTDMNSSSLGARLGGFLCRHKLSFKCAFHKHHNLNNLGIRQEIWQTYSEKSILFFKLFGKIDFKSTKSISVLKVFGIIDFHYAGEVTHPSECMDDTARVSTRGPTRYRVSGPT